MPLQHFKLLKRIYLTCTHLKFPPSLDGGYSKFLIDGAKVYVILQICLKQSLLPHQCEIAKLKPLFKEGFEKAPEKLPVVTC